jgi:predicted permease
MSAWQLDLRLGLRSLRRSPAFAVLAIVTLALGIGATTAIFSVVYGLLLRPLPYPNADRMAVLWEAAENFGPMSIAYPNYLDWRERAKLVDQIVVFRRSSIALSGDGEPERLAGSQASRNVFEAPGIGTQLGRSFTAEEDRPGGPRVAIISDGLWRRRFSADPAIVGSKLTLDGEPHEVVGVLGAGVGYPGRTDVWVPIGRYSDDPGWTRGNHPGIYGAVRIAPGATLEQVKAEFASITGALAREYPDSNTGTSVELTALNEYLSRDLRPAALALLAAVGFVLLIACVNVANLVSTRMVGRRRELAVHVALGAASRRLVRQSLAESLLLATGGALVGVVLADLGLRGLLMLWPDLFPAAIQIRLDAPVFGFAAGVALLSAIAFGLWPAWRAGRSDPHHALREGSHAAGDRRSGRAGRILGTAQVALTVVLLVGACLLTKSLLGLMNADLGMQTEHRLAIGVQLPENKYDEPARVRFIDALLPRLRAIPGVRSAGVSSNMPLLNGSQTSFAVRGVEAPPVNHRPHAEYAEVDNGYFDTMSIPLVSGRLFEPADVVDGNARAVVIDQAFVRKHFPDKDPLGQQIHMGHDDVEMARRTIVGVVGDVQYRGPGGEPPLPEMYFPYAAGIMPGFRVALATDIATETVLPAVRREIAALDPALPIFDVRTMDAVVEGALSSHRLNTTLMSLFAGLAMVLSGIGIYGVLAYHFARRTQEMGVRVALGATRREISRLVLGHAARIVIGGAILGSLGALVAGQAMKGLLVGVSPIDPPIFALALAFIAAVGFSAAGLPAYRACRITPIEALRQE